MPQNPSWLFWDSSISPPDDEKVQQLSHEDQSPVLGQMIQ